MSSEIDPELLKRSRRKFGGTMGAKAEKKEDATKAVPRRVTVDALAEDDAVLKRAKQLRKEAGKQ